MSEARVQGQEKRECKFFEVEVPSATTYAEKFVNAHHIELGDIVNFVIKTMRDLERKQANVGLTQKEEERLEALYSMTDDGSWEGYIRAYCYLEGHRTALLISDSDDSDWWVVVFDLDEDEMKRLADEMKGYADTIERALNVMPGDDSLPAPAINVPEDTLRKYEFSQRCYYLDRKDSNVQECLAKAKEILART